MRFLFILIPVICYLFLSCIGGQTSKHDLSAAEDSAAIMKEVLESKRILTDRVLNEKATEDSIIKNRIAHVGEFLNGGWFCILNNQYERNTRTFDLYLFDFDMNSEIGVHKMIISDNANLGDYIKHQKSYGLPFNIKDEITTTKTVRNGDKNTYMMRSDSVGEKFLLTLLDGKSQSLSFFSENNGEVLLSRLPSIVKDNGEIVDVFPTDISMSQKSEAYNTCSSIGSGWRIPEAEEFDGVFKQIFRNKTYNFKRFYYWTSSESKQPRFNIAFDTRFGKIEGHNNTAYVRPVRKTKVFNSNRNN